VHDKPLGGIADEIEGIASNQRQRWLCLRLKNRDIIRVNDFGVVHEKYGGAVRRKQFDRVPVLDVFQTAKKTIAVCRNTNVSGFPRPGCVRDPSSPSVERAKVDSCKYRDPEIQPFDPQDGKKRCVRGSSIRENRRALLRPQPEIDLLTGWRISRPGFMMEYRRHCVELVKRNMGRYSLIDQGCNVDDKKGQPDRSEPTPGERETLLARRHPDRLHREVGAMLWERGIVSMCRDSVLGVWTFFLNIGQLRCNL
jgi:hypothetical protein